ncbi:hypothetical protein OROGR_003209 [Orobanche gracilis]
MSIDCEWADMNYCVKTAFDDLCITGDGNKCRGRLDKRKNVYGDKDEEDDDQDQYGKFKSKNLKAERRRREKLNDRQLQLRSLMNKASIITDAITYIQELKKTVEELTHQLYQIEATSMESGEDRQQKIKYKNIDHSGQEMKICGITQQQQEQKTEVEASHINGSYKLWIRIVFQKKKGGLTKLMEAINSLGFDLTDTSITTSNWEGGGILFTTSAEGIDGGVMLDIEQIKRFLLETIKRF